MLDKRHGDGRAFAVVWGCDEAAGPVPKQSQMPSITESERY